MKRLSAIAAFVLAVVPLPAFAWGTTGHHLVNRVAMEWLPTYLPGFVRTPEATAAVVSFGTEMDRLKGAGDSWDRDLDPGHYVDVGDDGLIAGAIHLDALPETMDSYDKMLRTADTSPYRIGYLPYTIADGWEQLRKDFAYWQAFNYLATHAATPKARAAFANERALREDLTLHDIGVWAHFVGDGSQPLHVTVHYNDGGMHEPFEGAFVRDHVTAEGVSQLMGPNEQRPPRELVSQSELMKTIGTYLVATNSQVPKLYAIAKTGGFKEATPEAIAFATARVADGARELRDLIMLAYDNSAYESVGYPEIALADILSGKVQALPQNFGGD
jgi:hypothetical protein